MFDNRQGKIALVRYKGGPKGERAVDDSGNDIREVLLGCNMLPKGIDDAFLDMSIGEERTVTIQPENGFGLRDEDGVLEYPRMYIDNGMNVKMGDIVTWVNPASKMEIPAKVISVDERTVTLDLNHPFAGKTLVYKLQLLEIKD